MHEYILRHFLALDYRCTKALRDCPEHYPHFDAGKGVRRPIEILSHISRVLRFAQSIFEQSTILDMEIDSWSDEVDRFYREISRLDALLADGLPPGERIAEKLLQGPLSDAMTHVGQLSMLRRMAGSPIPGEGFYSADIKVGLG